MWTGRAGARRDGRRRAVAADLPGRRACASCTSVTRRWSTPGSFLSKGGKMKGFCARRQPVARYGYTVLLGSRNTSTSRTPPRMADLMAKNRRGEQERGFSMMLGRLFRPTRLGFCSSPWWKGRTGAGGECASSCPRGDRGLLPDLMRRDPADHPNGPARLRPAARPISSPQGKRDDRSQFELRGHAVHLDGDSGDGGDPARGAVGNPAGFVRCAAGARRCGKVSNAKYEGPRWCLATVSSTRPNSFRAGAVQILRAEVAAGVPVHRAPPHDQRCKRTGSGRARRVVRPWNTRTARQLRAGRANRSSGVTPNDDRHDPTRNVRPFLAGLPRWTC